MTYLWIIILIIGIALIVAAMLGYASSNGADLPSWFWFVFFVGIILVITAVIVHMSHKVNTELKYGDYYYYHPEWYTNAVDYPALKKSLPTVAAPMPCIPCTPCV
jgi:hypothetical protein